MPRAPRSVNAVENASGNEQNTNEKLTKKVAPAKNGASTRKASLAREHVAVEKAIQGLDAAEVPKKNTPDWDSWSKRYTVTLQHAIYTVHNIVANEETFNKLKKKGDDRTKKCANHLRTLKDWVRNAPGALPKEERHKEKAVTEKTSILLGPFVDWVRNENPFPGLSVPDEFFKLMPQRPRRSQPETAVLATTKAATTSPSESTQHELPPKDAWARLLVALAIYDYGLRPKWPVEKLMEESTGKRNQGLYATLSKFCKEIGMPGLSSTTSVRNAVQSALASLKQDDVERLQKRLQVIDDRKRAAD